MDSKPQHEYPFNCYVQGALVSLLMFLAGSTFALGVFIPSVEAAADPPHVLDGVWETAMGAMHFLSGPIMIVTGIYLDNGSQHVLGDPQMPWSLSKTFRVRLLSLISLLAFASFSIAALGSATSSSHAIFVGVSMQSFPLAIGKLCFLFSLILTYLLLTYFVSINVLPYTHPKSTLSVLKCCWRGFPIVLA